MTDPLAALDTLYEAALDPTRWEAALEALARALGGFGASIIPLAAPVGAMRIVASGVTKEHQHDWEQGWWKVDPRSPRALALGPNAGIITDRDIISPEEIAVDPFYQEFWWPRGFGETLAQLARPMPGHAVCISVHRDRRKGPYQRAHIARMAALGRHAARAMALSGELAAARNGRANLAEAFDLIAAGILFLGAGGIVTHVNRTGEDLMGDGFVVGHGGSLKASFSDDQVHLDRLVASALSATDHLPTADTAVLRRPTGKRSLLIQALKIRRRPTDAVDHILFGEALALLVVIDPHAGAPSSSTADRLRLYGLTAAEARVASMVGSGHAPKQVAETLGVSEGTVRIQLKQVYDKLDVARQSELARLVARLSAIARNEEG